MKPLKAIFALVVLVLGVIATAPASAFQHGGGHVRFGVFIGPGFGYPYYGYPYYGYPYYGYPYYGYPPYYYPTAPAAPTAYVEQGSAQPAPAQPQGYWYYCASSKGYYPYVKECPGGWQRVSPQPAN